MNIFKADSLKKVFLHLGIILLLFFGLLIFFFYVYLPNSTHHNEAISVPKLEGMDAKQAQEFLASKKLRFKINDSTYSSDVIANTVLTQHPLPDTKVKENRMIYVTVSTKNPPKVAMPQLIDLSLKGAQLTLKQYDLLLGNVISVPGQTDMVYGQFIDNKKVEPGTMIAKGTKINLHVGKSSGAEIEIPDFTGMSIGDAKAMASELGVLLDIRPNPTTTDGIIVKQKPTSESGAVIQTGHTIDVWTE